MTQGEIERLAVPIQKNLGTLESRVMADIVRRIKINSEITSAADWQINRLYQMGVSKKAIKKYIAEALDLNKKEVKKLYHDALYKEYIRNESLYKEKGAKWISFKKNKELQDLIAAVEEQTDKELKNITQSLGFAIRGPNGKIIQTPLLDFYQGTLDDAMNDIASGAFDYSTVLRRTILTMTNSGLRTVDYDSGWSNRVEVAGRRAVMTGFNQLQAKINEQVASKLKTDYFEVSWHGGARPEHQVWQGRVFTRKQLETVCGLGSVTGLCGANCYHSYNAFIPGVSVRTYTDEQLDRMNAEENRKKPYNGKRYTTYEALQKQRDMEMLMRKQRQDIKLLKEGKADEDVILAAKIRYRVSMDRYADFSEKMNLPQQKDRIYMDGLGRMAPSQNQYQEYQSEQEKKQSLAMQMKAPKKGVAKERYDAPDYWEGMLKKQGITLQAELSRKTLSVLNNKEKEALSVWSGGAYTAINNYKRNGFETRDFIKETAKIMESVLEKTKLETDLIAHRGVDLNALESMLSHVNGWKTNLQKAVGQTVTDKGFFATSPDKKGGFGGEVKFIVHCPKGTRAAYIADISEHPSERELLLINNSKFRIIKAEEKKDRWGEMHYK